MSTLTIPTSPSQVVYPDSDGKPMADNTLQYDWIVKITGGLRHLFADDPNVFVAGDLLWYPVEDNRKLRAAPDTMVVFGRPPGYRGSYCQWQEGGIAPQVVFEVLSPGNRFGEMSAKFDFYLRHGVEEYYIYNPQPDRLELSGFLRVGDDLVEIEPMHGHVSPRLGVRFEMDDDGMRLIRPDGRPFTSFEEISMAEERERQRADQERQRADQERQRADQERQRADFLQAELDRLRRGADSAATAIPPP